MCVCARACVWCAAYRSTSYNGAGSRVSVTYTEGYWEGDLAHDRLSISQFTPLIVQLEAIDASQDFFVQGADWQGILGLAYASLAKVSQVPSIPGF